MPMSLAAHPGQPVLVPPGDRLARQDDLALVGDVQAGHHVEQRRLAASGRSHDGDELAGGHIQVGAAKARTGASSASKVLRTPRTDRIGHSS